MKPAWLLQRAALTAELACTNPTSSHLGISQLSGLAALASLRPAPIACTDQHNPHQPALAQPAAARSSRDSPIVPDSDMLSARTNAAAHVCGTASSSTSRSRATAAGYAPAARSAARAARAGPSSHSHSTFTTSAPACGGSTRSGAPGRHPPGAAQAGAAALGAAAAGSGRGLPFGSSASAVWWWAAAPADFSSVPGAYHR